MVYTRLSGRLLLPDFRCSKTNQRRFTGKHRLTGNDVEPTRLPGVDFQQHHNSPPKFMT